MTASDLSFGLAEGSAFALWLRIGICLSTPIATSIGRLNKPPLRYRGESAAEAPGGHRVSGQEP